MEDVQRFYGDDPEQYAANTDREKMPAAFHEVRDRFLAYVNDRATGQDILDAGCGPGHDTDYFMENGYDAVGVDVTPRMAAHADREQRGMYGVMDIGRLGFDDAAFDGVWCNTAIFHVPPERMRDDVTELYRVLDDDGVMHISYKLGDGVNTVEKDGTAVDQFLVSHDAAQEMLEDAGFTLLEAQRNPVGEDRVFGNYFCQKR